jgi:peroxiredoxin family protein
MGKLVLAISTSCIDKLTSAGVVMSGAAADDMEVDVFVLVNGGHAFIKNKKFDIKCLSEQIQSAASFEQALKELSSPDWREFFELSKELTEVRVFVCSLAGKIAGSDKKEDFIDLVDDVCGIGEYIEAVQHSDVNIFI